MSSRRPTVDPHGGRPLILGAVVGAGMSLDLSPTQLDRYSRHIIMDEVGPEGQGRLLDGSVLVVGAGGLGSPVLQYLAAAGVGRLGVADDDEVERSNLQRQVIHGDDDVGRPKVDSAREFVESRNPDVEVEAYEERVDSSNVEGFVEEYDVVVDCSDNFATRYLVNDACTLAGVPFSHGAILRFEGQITTFEANEGGPCYRCLFPTAPEPGTVPDCATAGVLGVLPGTVGTIQATEAVKLLLGYGETLDGRFLIYDASDLTFEEIPVEPRPGCPVCGSGGIESVHEVDYEFDCAIEAD
jgi:adenylyltransferase/sulfurtransferase